MLDDDEKLKNYRKVMKENFDNKHLWVHRVDKIVEDMAGGNK